MSGATDGIFARNYGNGALTVTANGNVTGTGSNGIYASSNGGAIAITVAATGTVTSANAFAIETVGGPATVTVAGTVAGSMQIGGAGSSLTFQPGAVYKVFINGATASLATVNGTASLAGTVNASFQGGSSVNTTYTILTATGGFGATRFTGVISQPELCHQPELQPGRHRRVPDAECGDAGRRHTAQPEPAERRQRDQQQFQQWRGAVAGICHRVRPHWRRADQRAVAALRQRSALALHRAPFRAAICSSI